MAELIAGPTMVLQWISTYGTISLAGDYRTCTWSPVVDYVETQAGSDTHKSRLTALKDATASVTLVAQTGGTQINAAPGAGVWGTLIIGTERTPPKKRKITFPSFCECAKYEQPHSDI